MKTSNHIGGRYFGEIIRDVVIKRIQAQENRVAIEPRLSIYGAIFFFFFFFSLSLFFSLCFFLTFTDKCVVANKTVNISSSFLSSVSSQVVVV